MAMQFYQAQRAQEPDLVQATIAENKARQQQENAEQLRKQAMMSGIGAAGKFGVEMMPEDMKAEMYGNAKDWMFGGGEGATAAAPVAEGSIVAPAATGTASTAPTLTGAGMAELGAMHGVMPAASTAPATTAAAPVMTAGGGTLGASTTSGLAAMGPYGWGALAALGAYGLLR